MKSFICAAILIFISSTRPVFSMTGNELLEHCQQEINQARQALCLGYINGITDAYQMDGIACLPEGVTLRQVTDIVIQDLINAPAARHNLAVILVQASLFNAFRCSHSELGSSRPYTGNAPLDFSMHGTKVK